MKNKKDSCNIVAGYKSNPDFRKGQLSKVLNLDSLYSYVSVNLTDTDGFELLDKVLPYTIRKISDSFPFVLIRSASLKNIEIVFVTADSLFEISTKLYSIRSSIKYYFPNANLF